jgi:hypothetical protein
MLHSYMIFESINNTVFYHNTSRQDADSIIKNGWKLTPNKRGALFGKGIYFTQGKPNTRWGDTTIQVNVKPNNPLFDPEGNIKYEDNPLGKEILSYSGLVNEPSNPKKWLEGLYVFLEEKCYDSVYTMEGNQKILVVLDPTIIKNTRII